MFKISSLAYFVAVMALIVLEGLQHIAHNTSARGFASFWHLGNIIFCVVLGLATLRYLHLALTGKLGVLDKIEE